VPRETVEVNVSNKGVPGVYLMRALESKRLGCLPLVVPKPIHGTAIATISERVPCNRDIDQSMPWPTRVEPD
jgi:hypothetical protein